MTKVVKKRSKIGVVPSTLKKNQLKQRVRRGGVPKTMEDITGEIESKEKLLSDELNKEIQSEDNIKKYTEEIKRLKLELESASKIPDESAVNAADPAAVNAADPAAVNAAVNAADPAAVNAADPAAVNAAVNAADPAAVNAAKSVELVNVTIKGDNTLQCIKKYQDAIEHLISNDIHLKNINVNLFSNNDNILEKYILGLDITKITKYDVKIIIDEDDTLEIMEDDIKYLLRGIEEKKEFKQYELLYINSIHLLNVIHLINYHKKDVVNNKNILNLYKLQYKYYYLLCVKLRTQKKICYNFIRKNGDSFTYENNNVLTIIAFPQTQGGAGKKSLSVNKIKEIADMLKVSHSKCKSKESIMTKIKSIDLQKLTIEQLKIYCKLFNIKGCSKCKSKKSLLLHTKSNMKVR